MIRGARRLNSDKLTEDTVMEGVLVTSNMNDLILSLKKSSN